MFMGPDYADVARPLVDLTRKDVSLEWTELHTQALRQLKQRLIDFTTLQAPDTTKSFELYTDASGYAIGAVLEQEDKPIGFFSQVMNPTQQKYSIYDQELLALVTALDKWYYLLRFAKVTAHTDHQDLTYPQRLQASKPLRGWTARWLDFLAEFPDLRITYVQGERSQVADALSRRTGLPNTCSHDTPPAPLMLAVEQAREVPRSCGRPTNYRELAGIPSRRFRQRTLPSPPLTPPPEPNPVAERPTAATKTLADPPDVRHWRKLTRSVLFFAFPTKPQQTNQEKLWKSSFVIANSPSAT
ncbi:OSJNBa0061C08.12 protein, related [Eimeria necatrix]|uniref:OSJNBa0061C08.12 protein, related n=1 Tax=Eimeria necatrix TaxID=51315 RepID=U6MUH2_9EIME|nr:OSJNBa0061C08.12 protein, related [Eimeria necatrix]CDJ67877.1 OSJNBa0061C08.12 protein, related [Eimeria necatrix]